MANFNKYGVPFYAAAWKRSYVVLAGGGGAGSSGIPNAVVLCDFDFAANSLSEQPVVKHSTGSDLPYRMAVHPNGHGFVCAFPNSCRWLEWDEENGSDEDRKVGVKESEKELKPFEGVDQQLALAFNSDGSIFASGGEDGNLKVFKWPSMESILDEARAHTSVKDLDFSPDGKFLVSLGSTVCRVWDVGTSTSIASLPKENDEMFCGCRFSQINDEMVLYTAAVIGRGGSIAKWNTTTWNRISSKAVVRDTISAFDVSANGKFLACGTTQGDVWIINATTMRIHQVVKQAHLGFVTAMRFSRDSRALASASMDSSARVTIIEEPKKAQGFGLWLIILVILIAIAAYFWKSPGSLEPLLESFKKLGLKK